MKFVTCRYSPDAAASVFLLFGKIIFRDNPRFQEMMGLNQVLKCGARLLETPQPQPWDMSSRAVWSVNNWNLYQGDGDVIWDSSDITWKPKKNKRQHIHKHRHTQRLAGSFTSGNHCGSLFLTVNVTQQQCITPRAATEHRGNQNSDEEEIAKYFWNKSGVGPIGREITQ